MFLFVVTQNWFTDWSTYHLITRPGRIVGSVSSFIRMQHFPNLCTIRAWHTALVIPATIKKSNWGEDLKTTLKEKSTNKYHSELLLFLDVTGPQISISLLDRYSNLFIDRFLQRPLEQRLLLLVVFWLLLKSNVLMYLGWIVSIILFFVF